MNLLDQVSATVRNEPAMPLPPLRVAVVGCGPKGMFCLEQLARQLERQAAGRPLHVSIFEPAEFPGAGLVYDPRQPHYLRMNFAAEHINVWQNDSDGLSLLQWLRRYHPEFAKAGQFVPRAIVGDYLHRCFQTVESRLTKHAEVVRIQEQVVDLAEYGSGWSIVTANRRIEEPFDELLLAVGHEGWRTSVPESQQREFDIPHVYPTDRQLSPTAVPAGSRVALRGLGLTAIDAILAFTEGRGGSFPLEFNESVYQPSGNEPAKMYPYSRSGRPMLAKPIARRMALPDLSALWEAYAAPLSALADQQRPLHFQTEIWPRIEAAAEAALQAVEGSGVATWLESRNSVLPSPKEFRDQIANSVEVATGKRKPDAPWALGEAWRRLYPTLVNLVSHEGLTRDSWPHFRTRAAEMERLAFGPPVENCRKLVALIDCGLVDLTYLQGSAPPNTAPSESPTRRIVSACGQHSQDIDCHVNAVLPSAAACRPSGPLSSLTQSGKISFHDSGYGYRIDRSGRPITADGADLNGITLVGRPTEGSVLGNDTLNPNLHDQPFRWAQAIAQQLQRVERSVL